MVKSAVGQCFVTQVHEFDSDTAQTLREKGAFNKLILPGRRLLRLLPSLVISQPITLRIDQKYRKTSLARKMKRKSTKIRSTGIQ